MRAHFHCNGDMKKNKKVEKLKALFSNKIFVHLFPKFKAKKINTLKLIQMNENCK